MRINGVEITPTYGNGGIPGCYMCRVWMSSGRFIVTAVDIAGNELRWEATSDPTEVGNIVKKFSGQA